jgi:transcription initiation factor IIE alpha subunit
MLVTALNDQWQAARKLRYDEVMHRRSQVNDDLQRWQTDRLAHTVQLRQHLNQMYRDLQDETTLWLTQAAQQRQVRAQQVRQSLQDYVQQLRAESQAMMAQLEADRVDATIALQQKLRQDCQAMQEAVSELRLDISQELQQIQRRVKAIKRQSAVDRAGYRQEQAMRRSELLPELADYVADLQVQVKASLEDMATVHQQAAAVQRQQRQQDRQALTAEVDQLFTQLSEFRKDLQAHREAIAMGVWGTLPEKPLATGHPVVAQPAVAKAQPKPVAKPAMVTPPASPAPVPVPVAVAVAAKPEKPQSPSLEEAVYNYLHLSEGARLIEIESELGINRFQAVDALRSLIQKDLIVKEKDRTYHVQEEAVL